MLAVRISERMVRRMEVRRAEEVVRGRRGKRVLRSLKNPQSLVMNLIVYWELWTHSIDVMTFLFLNMTRFCTRAFLVSGESVP